MLDPIAILEAQRATRDLAESARPGSPTRPDRDPPAAPAVALGLAIRLRAGRLLRRLADLIEPAPADPCPPVALER